MDDRGFLTDWLIKSVQLLGDQPDDEKLHEKLQRMSIDELYVLADERQQKLNETAANKLQQAAELEMYQRMKRAGIRGIVK
jgi:hypothetical protein